MMPRAAAKIRRRHMHGQAEVLTDETEEHLVHGLYLMVGPPAMFTTVDQWRLAWDRWRDVVLPKVITHRPGTRPAACYITGEIPPRPLLTPLPEVHGWWHIDVHDRRGGTARHYLNMPAPYLEPEATYLHRLGIVDAAELGRHRAWLRDGGAYPLEEDLPR
jgi:hypothetical protein